MKSAKLLNWLELLTSAVILGCLVGLGITSSVTTVQAQDKKKVIRLTDTIKPQLKFTDVKVGQQERKLGESFEAESDWVKDLSFKLENISGKQIVYLKVNINFPETRLLGPMMSYGVTFGQHPNSKFKHIKQPMLLKPSEILEVSLDKEKDRIHKFLGNRQPIETIQKVELEIGFIVFEDKTAWAAGTFLRQDANNLERYNPIESEPQQ